ncbi:TipAS antibiotic-recognition domain-containing protein [Kribbella deserti]|uniref:TipAS antibiotic-recognition domain-containing protein n=1 Tax=Kribbella deserti TaxID=1926257 RepID=A0ABV6QF70_9ACTN
MAKRKIQSPMSAGEKRQVWGEFAAGEAEYLGEVEQRWGGTSAYAQTARRVARYGKSDWQRIKQEYAGIEARIRELIDAGTAPHEAAAMDVAEAQRQHVCRWYYDMSHEFQVSKSDLYLLDPRYREPLEDNTRPGAAEWLAAAIKANAERAETDLTRHDP